MPWLYWADCPLVCQDPKSITCQTYHMLAASLSTEAFMSGQETPNRNGATLPAQAACWDFSIAMHCGLFAAKKNQKNKPSSLAPSHMLCLATEPKPCAGSSSPGSLQRQAQQRAWLPAAGARAAAPGCFGREPWLTCWAACPSRASCFVRQQQAGVVGQCWCTVQLQLFV